MESQGKRVICSCNAPPMETSLATIGPVLHQLAGLPPAEFEASTNMWQQHGFEKGGYFNAHGNVCKYLGFITQGVFRSFIIDEKTGEEKNVFLYSAGKFIVTFKSFIQQIPCDYHTQALTDAQVCCIHFDQLQELYRSSHAWERFGRILAQEAFNTVISRTEGFLFKSPEERYLELLRDHPDIFNSIPLYHISSYLGIQGPSLSRIRKRLSAK